MSSTEVDICNMALLKIGQQQLVTSGDGTIANAAAGALTSVCQLIYPRVRDRLLLSTAWSWATRPKALYPSVPVDSANVPGWTMAYAAPSDYVRAQYIFNGARPGQGAFPILDDVFSVVPSTSVLPAINGSAARIPFMVSGGYVFTDFYESPPNWDATQTYTTGTVVTGTDGNSYASAVDSNLNHDPTTDAVNWSASTIKKQIRLVYVARVTDTATYPEAFSEALEWALAVDLSLSIATKPNLAQMVKDQARLALRKASADLANSGEPDRRPDARSITVRT